MKYVSFRKWKRPNYLFHVQGVGDVGIIWDTFIIFSFNMLYLYNLN